MVVLRVLGVLGHSQSLERGNRWIAELFRTEIWSWDRWTVWAGGGEASWLLFLEEGQWLKEPGTLLYKWNASYVEHRFDVREAGSD